MVRVSESPDNTKCSSTSFVAISGRNGRNGRQLALLLGVAERRVAPLRTVGKEKGQGLALRLDSAITNAKMSKEQVLHYTLYIQFRWLIISRFLPETKAVRNLVRLGLVF